MKQKIEQYIITNEPVFEISGVQYSVCCPDGGQFCTWDSTGKTADFNGIDDLLRNWIVAGKPFSEIADQVIAAETKLQ